MFWEDDDCEKVAFELSEQTREGFDPSEDGFKLQRWSMENLEAGMDGVLITSVADQVHIPSSLVGLMKVSLPGSSGGEQLGGL